MKQMRRRQHFVVSEMSEIKRAARSTALACVRLFFREYRLGCPCLIWVYRYVVHVPTILS